MTVTDRARAMFPLMPTEVFDEWLQPLIDANGWPFVTGHEVGPDKWRRMLLERSPADWAGFIWHSREINNVIEDMSQVSRDNVIGLHEHSKNNSEAINRQVLNSENRYWQAYELIIELQGFPGFATALEENGKLTLVDGHHRVSALLSFRHGRKASVPFWIARPA